MEATKIKTKAQVLLSTRRVKVHAILQNNEEAAIRADILSVLCDIPETHTTCPRTRKVVRSLVADGWPIISTPQGFVYTTDRARITACKDNLVRRATAILNRAAALERML